MMCASICRTPTRHKTRYQNRHTYSLLMHVADCYLCHEHEHKQALGTTATSIMIYFLFAFFFGSASAFFTPAVSSWERLQSTSLASTPRDESNGMLRREVMQKAVTFGALLSASPANAKSTKSRTTGYEVQHTEAEWSQLLSPQQNFILRQGGTESPYSSILEGEDRAGLFVCAGCGTPLFNSKEKFHSGTGWPR